MKTATTVALSGSIAAATLLAAGIALGRRVVMPRRAKYVRVHQASSEELTLDANDQTCHSGKFGVWFDDDDAGHATIGPVLRQDAASGTVTRAVLSVTRGQLSHASKVRWTGHVFAEPAVLHPEAREVFIRVEGGTAPAWLIPPTDPGDPSIWAIHVHGIRTTRITALRSVPVAQQLGYTSLVVSFRGDGEGPETPRNVSSLGQAEWRDVDAAIDYALHNGASSIVLFGWSMGASVTLLVTERSAHRTHIKAMVLIGPVTEWRSAIRAGATRAHLPQALGSLAAFFLSTRPFSRMVGLPAPIDFEQLDWTASRRLRTPCLVIHSTGDTEIPIALSRRFAAAQPEHAQLIEYPPAQHAWEFNLAPGDFNSTIQAWVRALPAR